MGSKKKCNIEAIKDNNVVFMNDHRLKGLVHPEYYTLKVNIEQLLAYGDSVLNKEVVDMILGAIRTSRKDIK